MVVPISLVVLFAHAAAQAPTADDQRPTADPVALPDDPGDTAQPHRLADTEHAEDSAGDSPAPFADVTPGPVPEDVSRRTEKSAAERAYERDKIEFDEAYIIQLTGNASATVWKALSPRLGDGRPLKGAEFYRQLGREDLRRKYARRRGARIGLIAGGSLAMAGGFAAFVATTMRVANRGLPDCMRPAIDPLSPQDPAGDAAYQACVSASEADARAQRRRGVGVGVGLTLSGFAAVMVGAFVRPHPIGAARAKALADEYNDDLYRDTVLGSVRLSPSFGPAGGGASVQGRF